MCQISKGQGWRLLLCQARSTTPSSNPGIGRRLTVVTPSEAVYQHSYWIRLAIGLSQIYVLIAPDLMSFVSFRFLFLSLPFVFIFEVVDRMTLPGSVTTHHCRLNSCNELMYGLIRFELTRHWTFWNDSEATNFQSYVPRALLPNSISYGILVEHHTFQ